MWKKVGDRLIYDCGQCKENIFDVQDIEHLGSLPRTFSCNGCPARYTAEMVDGKLKVYRGGLRKPKKKAAAKAAVTPKPPEPGEGSEGSGEGSEG